MPVRPHLPLRKFARAQALERLDEVRRQMRIVRRDPNPDAVHDLRVSIRRFSSVLQVFPECFFPKRAAQGRKRLKRVLKAAGQVRDRDIALSLAAQADEDGERLGKLIKERKAAARRLRRALAKRKRRKALAVARRAVRQRKPRPSAADGWRPQAPADLNAAQRLPALTQALFAAGREALADPVDPAELHALRLHTKRLRYTFELFLPCYGPELEERVRQLSRLQDMLGDINDCRASLDHAQTDEMRAYLDAQRDRLIAEFGRYWITLFDAPGECEGWMLELARRSALDLAGAAP